jgi:nucleoside-diphosphate-sugar epimerase
VTETPKIRDTFDNRDVLITGGLGFLGSNLALRLVDLGANVTIVDSLVEGCGGNLYNIASIAGRVHVLQKNIASACRFRDAIPRAGVIFNLAGEISHIHSMHFPRRDEWLNAASQLRFLEECTQSSPGVRVVYAGTRQIYGAPRYLPVDEDHPICPLDFNGIHKAAAAMYHIVYARTGKLDAVVLNFSNVYGPRMALSVPCQGFLGNFIRKGLIGRRLDVFGDGQQLRDPVYVDDAVEAILAAGAAEGLRSRTYNVGGPEPLTVGRMADIASCIAGLEPPLYRSFPPEQEAIDIGSYYADSSRIRHDLGWAPSVRFADGLQKAFTFYRSDLAHYVDPSAGEPECRLLARWRAQPQASRKAR